MICRSKEVETNMKINDDLAKVICDLEYEIGSECYNPNSYDGWNDIEGCDFRYPINYPDKDGEYTKIRSNIRSSYFVDDKDITADRVEYIKYRFGSNELFIGKGLINVLTYLEDRYGIDFVELEKQHKNQG